MKENELDLSGFDEAVNVEEDSLDLTGFDDAMKQPSKFERLLGSLSLSQENIETAKELGEDTLDFSKGVARGLTLEGLDEAGGAIGAGIERGLGAIGIGPAAVDAQLREQGFTGSGVDQSLADTYRDYQSGIAQDLKASEERSPGLTVAGQIAGGITAGTAATGALGASKAAQGAKSILDIAKDSGKFRAGGELIKRGAIDLAKQSPLLGLEIGLASDKQLIGEGADVGEFVEDVGMGLGTAGLASIGLRGATDVALPVAKTGLQKAGKAISEGVQESPLARQAKVAFEKYGQQLKVNPKSEKLIQYGIEDIENGKASQLWNRERASLITDRILTADKELGKLVGDSIEVSSKAGVKVDAQDIAQQAFDEITTLSQELPTVLQDRNFNATMQKILSRNYNNVSPKEIKAALEDISNSVDRISSMKLPTPELQEAANVLRNMRKNLDMRLKDSVPAYQEAAERFYQFRRSYMEQPIAGYSDPALDDLMYGDIKKGQKKLVDSFEDLVSRSTSDSEAVSNVEANFAKLRETTKAFEQEELKRVQKGKIQSPIMPDAEGFMREIRDFADDAAVRRQTRKTQESQAGEKAGLKNMMGIADTGRGAILTGAYQAGRVSVSKPAQKVARMGRNIYNAPTETLTGLAQKLESNNVTSSLGRALREGLESGDAQKRNAALFTIMQNPKARVLVDEENDVEE
jgi:hypothetical protein